MRPQIALVAAEPSGDQLGAGLIRELRRRMPDAEFVGVGGDQMAAQGCELLYRMERIGLIGVDELPRKLFDILRIRAALRRRFLRRRPHVFIGIDAPDFNLTLALRLKREGVRCVHYVSPTVWAWRGYRIRKIKRAVDHMLTLFPFEARYYRRHGVAVTCVGHPLADELVPGDAAAARREMGIRADTVIALLPGSRRSEVRRLTRPLIDAARILLRARPGMPKPNIHFLVPLSGARTAAEFRRHAGDIADLPLTPLAGRAHRAMQAADLVILACGTAALEAALLGRPHIVVYRVSKLSAWLMMPLRHVDHYSMTNHLLPEPAVPELILEQATADNIAREARGMLDDPARCAELRRQFADIRRQLRRGAARRAGEAVAQLIGAHEAPDACARV